MALSHYKDALKSGEDFMLRRLYIYATEAEYTRYTSTKEEEWRMALKEPARALIEYLESHDEPDLIHVDEEFEKNLSEASPQTDELVRLISHCLKRIPTSRDWMLDAG